MTDDLKLVIQKTFTGYDFIFDDEVIGRLECLNSEFALTSVYMQERKKLKATGEEAALREAVRSLITLYEEYITLFGEIVEKLQNRKKG